MAPSNVSLESLLHLLKCSMTVNSVWLANTNSCLSFLRLRICFGVNHGLMMTQLTWVIINIRNVLRTELRLKHIAIKAD